MRIIVTGAAGFVAPYFIRAIRQAKPNAEIFACTWRRQYVQSEGKRPTGSDACPSDRSSKNLRRCFYGKSNAGLVPPLRFQRNTR